MHARHTVAYKAEYGLQGLPIEEAMPPFPDDDTWLICAFGGTQHVFSVPCRWSICTEGAVIGPHGFHERSWSAEGSLPSSPGIDGHMEASCCTCATLTVACNWAGIKDLHAALTGTNAEG